MNEQVPTVRAAPRAPCQPAAMPADTFSKPTSVGTDPIIALVRLLARQAADDTMRTIASPPSVTQEF